MDSKLSLVAIVILCGLGPLKLANAKEDGAQRVDQVVLEQVPGPLWPNGIGSGMASDSTLVGGNLGVSIGLTAFGSKEEHDLALATFSYGKLLGGVMATNHWWRGNLELRLEFLGGAEFNPSTEWVVGLTPHLRYHFATGTRLVPFLDGGFGVSATSIGPPDLSGVFEFNEQLGGGLEWFVRDNLALTIEGRYLHMSCAGLSEPNLGLNGVMILLGMTWLY